MTRISIDSAHHRRAFALWLRSGRRPNVGTTQIELKFNSWHDPDDGRFTHAGAGRLYGPGGAATIDRAPKRSRSKSPKTNQQAALPAPIAKVGEFIDGVKHGVRDVGTETIAGLREVATTNPVTTVRNFGEGVARTIDAAMAAEDVPAREQVRRVRRFVGTASAHDLGYVTGRVAGNAGLAAVPGGAAAKISRLRWPKTLRPRETFHPPQIHWQKENITKATPSKIYNDTATGARRGQAPAILRVMSDGSRRPVKFDGVDGDYLIDRKWKIVDAPRARAAALRQSDVLAQHRLIGIWEVPNDRQRIAGLKLFRRLEIINIKIRVIKP